MKNIHVLPTDEQIKNVGDLVKDKYGDTHIFTKNDGKEYGKTTTKLNIYITSDEEIKKGDFFYSVRGFIEKAIINYPKGEHFGKLILTTNQDLIKDGVQSITDEFLEWFLKNPSCEEVEVKKVKGTYRDFGGNVHNHISYKAIIPKEEPKQEILEEVAERFDNKDNELVEGVFNPENWGKRLVKDKKETLEEVAERLLNLNELDNFRDYHYKQDLYNAFIIGIKYQQERSYSEEDMLKSFMAGIKCESNKGENFEQFIKQFKNK